VTAEADGRAYVVTDVTVRLPSEPDLRAALGVAVDAAGGAWLYDERRLVRHDAQGTQLLASEGLRRLACHHCVAPTGADRGSSIWHGLLRELADGAWADAAGQAPDLAAVDTAGPGATWAVAAGPDPTLPKVLRQTPDGWQPIVGVPDAAYVAVAARSASQAWLAGGVGSYRRDGRWWPVGDGVLVHARPGSARVIELGDSTLLAVTSPADDEAWAVGYDGRIVHVHGDLVDQMIIADEPWLTSVWSAGRDDVWFAGERGTLLRWDGSRLLRIALGRPDLTITGLAGATDGTIWACGPTGIVRPR
jgi:hypothetical protein